MRGQFHRGHFHGDRERHSRHPFGGRGFGRGHGRAGRVGRFLEHGDLRFVLLALIEEQPRHGYDLIKALEDRSGGSYRPSPGVIYPTVSLLEDEGFVRQAAGDTGRKLFEITVAGRAALNESRSSVEAAFARIAEAAERANSAGPRVGRAMANLHMALEQRLSTPVSADTLDKIVGLLDQTAQAVEKV